MPHTTAFYGLSRGLHWELAAPPAEITTAHARWAPQFGSYVEDPGNFTPAKLNVLGFMCRRAAFIRMNGAPLPLSTTPPETHHPPSSPSQQSPVKELVKAATWRMEIKPPFKPPCACFEGLCFSWRL